MKDKGKLKSVLGNLDLWAAAVVLGALMVLTFVGVLRRYIFRDPIAWMEEVQQILFLWAVFLSAGAAFRSGGHIAIEILVDSLPKKIGRVLEIIDIPFQLIILGYLTLQSVTYWFDYVENGRSTIFLGIPYSVAYVVLPIGCILMIISVIYSAYRDYFSKKKGEEA